MAAAETYGGLDHDACDRCGHYEDLSEIRLNGYAFFVCSDCERTIRFRRATA